MARLIARGELNTSEPQRGAQPPGDVDEALAAFGLTLEEAAPIDDDRVFYLWPELQPALLAWVCVQTQWRTGMAGATGLDYAGVDAIVRTRRLARGRRRCAQLMADLQVMERAALDEWARQRQQPARAPH